MDFVWQMWCGGAECESEAEAEVVARGRVTSYGDALGSKPRPKSEGLTKGVGEVRECFFLNYEQLRLVHPKPKLTTVITLLTISLDTSSAPHASQPCRTT